MPYVTTNPRRFGLDRPVRIPRSRVRAMLDHLGAAMSRDTTRPGAAKFGATFGPEREGADTTLDRLHSTASPLALAVEQHRAAMLEARRVSKRDDCGDLVCDAEETFRDAARSAFPLDRPDDALAAVEWVLGDLREETAGPNMTDSDEIRIELLGEAVRVLGRMVAAPSGRLETSVIPELDITFGDAARRARSLLEANTASAERDEDEDGKEGRQRAANSAERERLDQAIAQTPAVTFGDVLTKLERLCDPEVGVAEMGVEEGQLEAIAEDIRRLLGATPATVSDDEQITAEELDLIQDMRAMGSDQRNAMLALTNAFCLINAAIKRVRRAGEREPRVLAALAGELRRNADQIDQPADAELIDTTARWFAMRDQLNDGFGEDRGPTEAEQAVWGELHSRISALPCSTAAGALAKVAVLTSSMQGGIAALDEGQLLAPLLHSIQATTAPEPVATITRHLAQHIKEINEDKDYAQRTLDSLSRSDRLAQRTPPKVAPSLDLLVNVNAMESVWRTHAGSNETAEAKAAYKRADLLAQVILNTPPRNAADVLLQAEVARVSLEWAQDNVADLAQPGMVLPKGFDLKGIDLDNVETIIANSMAFIESARDFIRGSVDFDPSQHLAAFIAAGHGFEQDATAHDIDGADAAFGASVQAPFTAPQRPTANMIAAGTTAAGITAEQFETAYAAAVEALTKERAA